MFIKNIVAILISNVSKAVFLFVYTFRSLALKMKRQQNILKFMHKIPRTESSVEEATENATVIPPSLMNNTGATSASDRHTIATVSPSDQSDAASSLPDCWSAMQYEDFQKKYDGLISRSKKLGCDHCAKI